MFISSDLASENQKKQKLNVSLLEERKSVQLKHASDFKAISSQVEKLKEKVFKLKMENETLNLEKEKLTKKLEAAKEDVMSSDKRIQELLA